MTSEILLAGFGGQGILFAGKILAYCGLMDEKEVSWLPSYGPEMRGGTANCSVIVSDKPVGSPVITNDATSALVLNLPSLDKFENDVVPGGKIVVNSSLIDKKVARTDVEAYYFDANKIAAELGNVKAVNMVMLGAYLELCKPVSKESIMEAFLKVFGEDKAKLLPLNEKALMAGAEAVRK